MEETNNMNDSFSEVKIIKPKPVRLCQNSKKKKFKKFITILIREKQKIISKNFNPNDDNLIKKYN